jgi:acyl-CoA reductase-like NAD-dependent aldehyde dehydrogenase
MIARRSTSLLGPRRGELPRRRENTVRPSFQHFHRVNSLSADELHQTLSELYARRACWLFLSPRQRIELLERCVESVAAVARDWVDIACEIKRIDANDPSRAEEVLSGPVIALRYLRLMLRNQHACELGQPNPLPGRVTWGADRRWLVPVFPIIRDLYDPVCFINFRGHVWLKRELSEGEAQACVQPSENRTPTTALVLGAGNVTGIVAADVLGKLFQEQQVVLLKLHPLTDPLRPVLQRAFAPLIEFGCLRILSGDAEFGTRAIHHPMVDTVHITGSARAHDAIVWGSDSQERGANRKPVLSKPITSELGNVTPWIIVPGRYSATQLQAQVDNVAASIINNAGFNCVATRVLITCRNWPQREEFLTRLQALLSRHPRRVAYYPGAIERFERFTGDAVPYTNLTDGGVASDAHGHRLPWTLIRDVDPLDSPLFCREESFVPVCAEMPLPGDTDVEFLHRATDFANEQLWGTLCATLTIPPAFRGSAAKRTELDAAVGRLRYGTVCLNQWSGIAFALLTLPWGGHPSGTLLDPQSGLGSVHNTFGVREFDKSVLEGPLTVVPKPVWSPGHRSPEKIAWKLFDLYHQPSLQHLAELSFKACAAMFQ